MATWAQDRDVTPDWKPERTTCKHGHSLENAYINSRGIKECRQCKRDRTNKARRRELPCPSCGKIRTVWSKRQEKSLCLQCDRRSKRDPGTTDITCPCGKVFKRGARDQNVVHCSRECRRRYGGYVDSGRIMQKDRKGKGPYAGKWIEGWTKEAKGEYACRNCGVSPVDLHHAIPRSKCKAIEADLRNALPLCRNCHMRWHHKTITIYQDVFTEEERVFLRSAPLTGENADAWMDRHYPKRPPATDPAEVRADLDRWQAHWQDPADERLSPWDTQFEPQPWLGEL